MTIANDNLSGALTITGTIEITTATALLEALQDCLLTKEEIVLDLSGVDGCDTPGLQVLLGAKKNADALKKPFRLVAISPSVSETSKALGFSLAEPAILISELTNS